MAVTAKAYSHMPEGALKELLNLSSDTLKCMLCTSSYTPDQDAHDFKDDVDNEVSGTGYTAGGVALTSVALTISGKVTKLDAADAEWADSTITARYAVLYDDTPAGDAAKPLMLYVDFGEDKASEDGTFKVKWHTDGVLTVTVA